MKSMYNLFMSVRIRTVLFRIVLPIAIVIALLDVKLSAQPVLTINEAIATALQNNYDIRLARNDSAIAALDYEYRNAVFLPRINAGVGTFWTHNNQKQEFSSGDQRSGPVESQNVNAAVNLDWTLFD